MGRAFRTQASLACCNILIASCRYQDDVTKEVKEESFRLDASAKRQLLRKILFCGAVVVDTVGILVFTRSFAPAVLVQLGMFTHSKLRRGISGACGLVRAGLSQAAVGESRWRSTLFVSDKLNVDHRVYLPEGDSRYTVPIEMIALDDYFKPGERVDLIKMDIQKYELHALRGASRVLADNPGIKLLFEFWPYGLKQAGANWVELIGSLKENGKLIQQVSSEGLAPFDPRSANERVAWYINLFTS